MNLMKDFIQGKLCEKGFMKEKYDEEVNDLVRNLTPDGELLASNLLNEPVWMEYALKGIKIDFYSKFPPDLAEELYLEAKKELEKNAMEGKSEEANRVRKLYIDAFTK